MSNSRSPMRKIEKLFRINPVNLRGEDEGFNCLVSGRVKKKIKIDTEEPLNEQIFFESPLNTQKESKKSP